MLREESEMIDDILYGCSHLMGDELFDDELFDD